ncbi:hypothetical protein B0H14DRAFT_3863194 [Mycena olivaceomarginata]|nr:hypothetical protein B0H14DRAFT_3863194 [Mycena olivaceomarginata]
MPAATEPPPRSTLRPPSVLIPAARDWDDIDDFYLENTDYLGFGWGSTGLADEGCADYGCLESDAGSKFTDIYHDDESTAIHTTIYLYYVSIHDTAADPRPVCELYDRCRLVPVYIYLQAQAVYVAVNVQAIHKVYLAFGVRAGAGGERSIDLPIDDVCIKAISHPALEAVEPRVVGLATASTASSAGAGMEARVRTTSAGAGAGVGSTKTTATAPGRTLSTSTSASRLSSRTSPASTSSARVPGAEATSSSPQTTTSPRQTGAGAGTGDTWASSLMPAPRARKVTAGYASPTAASRVVMFWLWLGLKAMALAFKIRGPAKAKAMALTGFGPALA